METSVYTIRLETQSPGTVPVSQVREQLQNAGFSDAEQVFSSGSCFVLSKPVCVFVAQLDMDENTEAVRFVKVSLDLRRLLISSIPFAAKTLADVVCSLACEGGTSVMAVHADGMPSDSYEAECKQPCDLYLRLEKAISQQKQSPQQGSKRRPFGLCAGTFTVPDDFDSPLPDDFVNAFESE